LPFQSILTTHSTHITSHAGLVSYVVLTQTGTPAIASSVPARDAALKPAEVRDLVRLTELTEKHKVALISI
jgi:putative ATP-dependent endonuclease of OLD family